MRHSSKQRVTDVPCDIVASDVPVVRVDDELWVIADLSPDWVMTVGRLTSEGYVYTDADWKAAILKFLSEKGE